jgi:hypothetical protein
MGARPMEREIHREYLRNAALIGNLRIATEQNCPSTPEALSR